jgi:hypothetical protein
LDEISLGMMPALTDVFRLGKMRSISPFSIFRGQNTAILLYNHFITDAVALLSMTLLMAFRLEKITFDARMDMGQILFFLVLLMFQEYKILADHPQR